MSNAALRTLQDALKRGTFDAAYYICGEDDFQKESAMKQLVGSSIDASVREFNLDIWRAQEVDPKSFDAAVSSMPMMAERRVVVIRDVGSLKKDARKAVEGYLAKPVPNVVLLLVEASGAKTDKEFSQSATLLDFDLLSADRVPRWIAHQASTELKVLISAAAIELLQEAVGNDLHQLVAELEKLASYTSGEEITEEAVSAIVGIRRGETMADLLDAIGRRDSGKALELLDHVLAQPKTTAVSIVMALATQMMALAWGRAKIVEGLPAGRLQYEFFNLLKQSGSAFTGRPWGTAATAWAGYVNSWDKESLDHALNTLLKADSILKESRFSSEEQALATLILAICSGDERKIAA